MNDDERIVDAVRPCVEHRRLGDEELGNPLPPERGAILDVKPPQQWVLRRAHPHGIALEEEPDAPLPAEDPEDLADHLVDAGHRAQRVQRRAVGGMFPRHAGNVGKCDARTGSGEGGHHELEG